MAKALTYSQARRKVDLPELLRSYGVNVERAGRIHHCCCPIHTEKTPSFKIFPGGRWYCFGACQEGGYAAELIMKLDGCSRSAALAKIGDMVGEPVQGSGDDLFGSYASRETLYLVNRLAEEFFIKALDAQKRRNLYHERGINDESIAKYGLGYAPPRGLKQVFRGHPISAETMKESGLILQGGVSFFRNRLIIPYRGITGKTTGFVGRAITPEDAEEAKYVNTQNTIVFRKRDELYLLDHAREAIRETGQVILVEGTLDAIMCHQMGIKNVVAIGGTAVTREHAYALRHVPEVIFALDGDKAGVTAALRSIGIITSEGVNLKVAILPNNDNGDPHDPDSFLRDSKHGPAAFVDIVGGAKPYFFAFHDYLKANSDGTSDSALQAGKELIAAVAFTSNPFEQARYIDFIAEEFGVDRNSLGCSVASLRANRAEASRNGRPDSYIDALISNLPIRDGSYGSQNILVRHLLHNDALPKAIAEALTPDLFSDRQFRLLVEAVRSVPNYRPRDIVKIRERMMQHPELEPRTAALIERKEFRPMDEWSLERHIMNLRDFHTGERLRQLSKDARELPDTDPRRQKALDEIIEILDKA